VRSVQPAEASYKQRDTPEFLNKLLVRSESAAASAAGLLGSSCGVLLGSNGVAEGDSFSCLPPLLLGAGQHNASERVRTSAAVPGIQVCGPKVESSLDWVSI